VNEGEGVENPIFKREIFKYTGKQTYCYQLIAPTLPFPPDPLFLLFGGGGQGERALYSWLFYPCSLHFITNLRVIWPVIKKMAKLILEFRALLA
jgi:hypothetical protein